jgi:HSP20 family protein
MNIIRYKTTDFTPRSSLDRLSSLKDLFDSAFQLANPISSFSGGWTPALDVYEDDEKVTVQVELAGLKKEDIDLSIEDDVLTISGERKSESERKEGESCRRERVYGAFRRSVSLPAPVKSDAVKAAYQDGVLTVTLPKAEEAKPRKIQIELN